MEIHLTIAKYQESGVIYRYQFFIWRDFLSFLHKTIVTIIMRMSSCIISVYEYRYSYIVTKGTSINHVDRFLKTPPPFINSTFLRFYDYVCKYLLVPKKSSYSRTSRKILWYRVFCNSNGLLSAWLCDNKTVVFCYVALVFLSFWAVSKTTFRYETSCIT